MSTLAIRYPSLAIVLSLLLCVAASKPVHGQDAEDLKRRPVVGEGYIEPPPPKPPELVDDLRSYVEQRMREYYVSGREIYDPAAIGLQGMTFLRLTPVRATPVLAGNLEVYCGDLGGLAVMDRKGRLTVWGRYPCKGLRMSGGPARELVMGRKSPWLAALDKDGKTLRMVDLRACGPANVWLRAKGKDIERAAASENGDWIAAVASDSGVYAGPALGPLEEAAKFDTGPLEIGFSTYEGVLVSLDRDGRVVFWGMRPGRKIGEAVIEGDFTSARLKDDVLRLVTTEGEVRRWNIVERRFVESNTTEPTPSLRLELSDGALFLDTGLTRWKKSVAMRQPVLMLYHSPSAGSLKLEDVDGATRYYDAETGLPAKAVNATDWVWLPEKQGIHKVGDQEYRVTDEAYQKGGKALICRYAPDTGFYVWWESRAQRRSYAPHPGKLPARRSLLQGAQPEWVDLRTGRLP